MNTKRLELLQSSLGDVVIDGLLKGILAGAAMLLYLLVTGLLLGEDPALMLARFSPEGGATPFLGSMIHLGVSAIYGVFFGLICWFLFWRRRSSPTRWILVFAGLAYGLALWLIAQFLLLPGTGSSMAQFAVGNLAIAHLLYGALLGLLVSRSG
jgi:hypothetical protein